jgi:hypothetical protein
VNQGRFVNQAIANSKAIRSKRQAEQETDQSPAKRQSSSSSECRMRQSVTLTPTIMLLLADAGRQNFFSPPSLFFAVIQDEEEGHPAFT